MHHHHYLRALVAITGFCVHAEAQATWVVGNGGSFLVVQHAIDSPLVQPGDVLQLVPGPLPHEGFYLDKALTIRGPATIEGSAIYSGSYRTTIEITAGHAQLIDLTFAPSAIPLFGPGVVARLGLISFDNCQFEDALVTRSGSRVTLNHCTVQSPGSPSALKIDSGSYVAAVQTTVTGGHDRGIENWGHFQGEALDVTVASGYPIRANGFTWIADSTLMVNGFSGLVTTSPNTFFARIVTNASFVNTNMTAPLFGVWFAQAEPQVGMPYDLVVRGEPSTAVLIELSLGLQVTTGGGAIEPSWLLGQTSFPFVVLGTDVTGNASLPMVIPMIPALRGVSIWAHASANFNGLHRSPPAGGMIR